MRLRLRPAVQPQEPATSPVPEGKVLSQQPRQQAASLPLASARSARFGEKTSHNQLRLRQPGGRQNNCAHVYVCGCAVRCVSMWVWGVYTWVSVYVVCTSGCDMYTWVSVSVGVVYVYVGVGVSKPDTPPSRRQPLVAVKRGAGPGAALCGHASPTPRRTLQGRGRGRKCSSSRRLPVRAVTRGARYQGAADAGGRGGAGAGAGAPRRPQP